MPSRELEREINHYKARTPESSKRQKEATRYLPGGSSRDTIYFDPYPIFIDHGKGHYLFDVDGNQYLDFMINATSLIMGHAHPLLSRLCSSKRLGERASAGPRKLR